MKILITGASGFIGGRLAEYLSRDHTVYGLLHDSQLPLRHHIRWRPLIGDITHYPRMLDIVVNREIQHIYHLAAKSIVRNCKCDPIGCFHANVLGTVNLLEAARHCDTIEGILCVESDKAYGPGPVPYKETQRLQPESVYEASKACVTHVAQAYHKNYGIPVFTVRSANVYGPGDDNMTRLIPNTITRVLRGQYPQITTGAARFVREFFYIDDFVSTVTGLMDKKPWGETFNVGSGETVTVAELAGMICGLLGEDGTVADEWRKPANLVEIPAQMLCLDKLDKWLPGRETVPLREGLERTIEWYRNRSR